MGCDDHNLGRRRNLAAASRGFNAVQQGHADVKKNYIRLRSSDRIQNLAAVAHRLDGFKFTLQQLSQAFGHQRVIFSYEYSGVAIHFLPQLDQLEPDFVTENFV
jgi:hypothetical protein